MYNERSIMRAQQAVHELIAQQAPLEKTLDAIDNWVETMLPNAVTAFMRANPNQQSLSLYTSQRFSGRYQRQLQDVPIGNSSASFGCAAYQQQQVITEDIRTDSRWLALHNAAEQEGLRACWSNPVMTVTGELLGTFDTYFPQRCSPDETSKDRLRLAASLVALAVVRDRDSHKHRSLSEWYRSLFVNHPDGVYEFDLDGRFQRGNAALSRITGYPEEALVGCHFNGFIEPNYQALTQASFDIARRGGDCQYETVGTHHDGHTYYLEVLNFPVSVDGEIVGVYGICRDITADKQAEGARKLLERGIQATPNGVLMTDASKPDMPLLYANDAFYRLTGYIPEEVLGRNCRFLQGPDTDQQAVMAVRKAIAQRESVETPLLNYRKDGTSFWNFLSLSPVFDEKDVCTHYIGIQQDITQHRAQEAQIAYQATHDLLTGLPNRTALDERLKEAFERAQQSQSMVVVMHLDLDDFKTVNDGLGHHIGNLLLVAVAERLQRLIEPSDTVARLTGDEFAMVFANLEGRPAGKVFAERVLDAFTLPFKIDDKSLHISASIGIACNCGVVDHAHELMQRAGLAMGDAKQQGRNTWHWYQGDVQRITEEAVLLRHDLHTALHEEQFELYYQPIVEAVSGRIHGLEG